MNRLPDFRVPDQLLCGLPRPVARPAVTPPATVSSGLVAQLSGVSAATIRFPCPDAVANTLRSRTTRSGLSFVPTQSGVDAQEPVRAADPRVQETLSKLHALSRRCGGACFDLHVPAHNGNWLVVSPDEQRIADVLPRLVGVLNFQQSLEPHDLSDAGDPVHRAMVMQGITDGMLYANLQCSDGITMTEGRSIGPYFIGTLRAADADVAVDLTAKAILFNNEDRSFAYEGLIVIDASGERRIVNALYDCRWVNEHVDPADGYTQAMTGDLQTKYRENTQRRLTGSEGLSLRPAVMTQTFA